MKPRNITEDHIRWLVKWMEQDIYTEYELGALFEKEWPEVFRGEASPRNIILRLKAFARDRGIVLPKVRRGPKTPPAHTLWMDEVPELVLPYTDKLIVLSDMHVPLHNVPAVEMALGVVEEQGIQTAVWNGDFFDSEYKGHKFTRSVYAAGFFEMVNAAIAIVDAFTLAGIKEHVFLFGNHDDKAMRSTDGEFTFKGFLQNNVFEKLDREANFTVTERYYAVMKPKTPKAWPFNGPDNFPTYFTHQKNYSKVQLSVAEELCSIEMGNVISGHQHHLTAGFHRSNLMFCADAGTLQDPRLPSYKNVRHSRHPKWACGFITLIDGKPHRHPWHPV